MAEMQFCKPATPDLDHASGGIYYDLISHWIDCIDHFHHFTFAPDLSDV